MADDTTEEDSDKPKDKESKIAPDEIISHRETQTITPSIETENMDVHHHAHHEGVKNWKSYFREFMMLFLAVFCGFLAEYKLEHVIEKEKERELATSFYNELKGDSIAIKTSIANRQRKDAAFSYLKKFFRDSSKMSTSKAFSINFFYAFATFSPSIFEPNDAVLNQLKNSGSLRYFKDQALQELTGQLSVAISKLKSRNEMEWTYVHEIINPYYIKHNDQNWVDQIDHDSSVFTFVAFQDYERSDDYIPFHFQNAETFDKVEAINLIGLYQLTFRGSLRRQYHDYEMLNAKLLEALRKEYKMK